MNTVCRTLAVAGLAATLAACGLFPSKQDRAIRNSQPYQVGYADGCAAANAAGASFRDGPVRNEEAFRDNAVYRAGWNTGYASCRQPMNRADSDPMNPIPQPNPGH